MNAALARFLQSSWLVVFGALGVPGSCEPDQHAPPLEDTDDPARSPFPSRDGGNEARCADELDITGTDAVECAARCAALERDPQAQPLVAEHLRCVRNAPTCKLVLECP